MRAGDEQGLVPRSRFCNAGVNIEVVCRAAREDAMSGKGKKSEQRKKLVKKLAKKVIRKAKKEEKKSNGEVDRSDVKPPSPFSS
jgi:hypothetical protein